MKPCHLITVAAQAAPDKVWSTDRRNAQRYTSAITAAGGVADTFDLPAMGLRGNSHMVMMDKNSDEVARLIRGWLVKQGLEK